jgi:dolichol-phosphate mannosyltransferase
MTTAPTLVALATYNEAENLPGLVDEILRVLPDAEVLVVDDNSPDGTGHWCDEHAKTEPRLRCLHRPRKLGLGSATLDAIRFALVRDYDVLATLDADWSHDPADLTTLVKATRRADVVIGSRYVAGGEIEGWPLYRRILSRSLNALDRLMLRLPVRDASGAFRAYRMSKLRELQLEQIRSSGYAYLEEVLWHLHRAGATFAEVPIIFRRRRAGESKINLREAAGKLATILRLSLRPTP